MAQGGGLLFRLSSIFASVVLMCTAFSGAAERKAPSPTPAVRARPAGPVQPMLPAVKAPAGTQAQPAAPGQPVTQTPAVTAPAKVVVAKPQPLQRPDLVATGFTVNQGAMQTQGMHVTFPFQVTVRNAGNAQTPKPFYVTMQESPAGQTTWQGGNNPDNCFKVDTLLAPNQSYVVSGRLKVLAAHLSNQTMRVRALADFACLNEFPPQNGDIGESNENNNFSNDVSLSGGYLPNLAGVHPDICIKGVDECHIAGTSFGSQQGNHTVVVQHGNTKTPVTIKHWYAGVVYFTVPTSAPAGESQIYIADSGSLNKVSGSLTLKVAEKKALAWDTLLTAWDVFKDAFSLRLHTWAGGCGYNNQSQITLFQPMSINVPNIQIDTSVGHYRFLVNDLKSAPGGITLSKANTSPNQLRLNVAFESAAKELIGCYKVLGPAGQWRRAGAPDIEVNNGQLSVVFTLSSTGSHLDYGASATFNASVDAHNSAANDLMNAFLGNWNSDVKSAVSDGVRAGLSQPAIKSQVISSLMDVIKLLTPVSQSQTITKIEFTASAINITYY